MQNDNFIIIESISEYIIMKKEKLVKQHTGNFGTQEWLIDKVKYYRKFEFFNNYAHLQSNEIANKIIEFQLGNKPWIEKKESNYRDLFEEGDDWLFLRSDRERVLYVATDVLYGSLPTPYNQGIFIQTLKTLAYISRNIFLPQNIIDIDGESIEFELNNQKYIFSPQSSCDDELVLAQQINPIIKSTGYQFEFWNLCPDIFIVVFTEEEKTQLIKDGNWW